MLCICYYRLNPPYLMIFSFCWPSLSFSLLFHSETQTASFNLESGKRKEEKKKEKNEEETKFLISIIFNFFFFFLLPKCQSSSLKKPFLSSIFFFYLIFSFISSFINNKWISY